MFLMRRGHVFSCSGVSVLPGTARMREEPLPVTKSLAEQLAAFREFGTSTKVVETPAKTFRGQSLRVATYVNEFWTSKQRAANSLHEVSYRACFKPQLPRFFLQRLTRRGDLSYDPFMGRGTTLLEAALLERVPCGCDISPLSRVLIAPRLRPPTLPEIIGRLQKMNAV